MLTRAAALVLVIAFCPASFAQQACSAGQARLRDGEPCIPSSLMNYLYCLSQSGGGKIEVVKKEDTTKNSNLEVTIGGKGSGVVIKGEGSGAFKSTETTRAIKELSEKLSPELTKNCKELASAASASTTRVALFCETPRPNEELIWIQFDDADRSYVLRNEVQIPGRARSGGTNYSLSISKHGPLAVGWCEQADGNTTFLCYEVNRQSSRLSISEGPRDAQKHIVTGSCEPYTPTKPKV